MFNSNGGAAPNKQKKMLFKSPNPFLVGWQHTAKQEAAKDMLKENFTFCY